MTELVADCPRCDSKHMTFSVLDQVPVSIEHGWLYAYEVFCECRHCHRTVVFVLKVTDYQASNSIHDKGLTSVQGAINHLVRNEGYVSIKDMGAKEPPEHLPPDIESVFREAAKCYAVGCYNAAATMFRLCIDLATRSKLPEEKEGVEGLNSKVRRDLGLRLPWLFDNKILPGELRELSTSIKEDGNDGAHAGNLTEEDAEDILDFTDALLDRLYTEPERLRLAAERRAMRRRPVEK